MNAKEEFLSNVVSVDNVLCAYITFGGIDIDNNTDGFPGFHKVKRKFVLRKNWDTIDLETFLSSMNEVNYHDGYGQQFQFGYIWMKDGTWLERSEDAGAECWEHKVFPPIPEACL